MRVLALALLAAGAAATAAASNATEGAGLDDAALGSVSLPNGTTSTARAASGVPTQPPPRAVAPATPLAQAPPATLSLAQAAQARALGLGDPASIAAFFGVDQAVLEAAAASTSASPTTPKAAPPASPCSLTVSADLPPDGSAIPACSPVTVYATVAVTGGLPVSAPPLDGFITFSTDGIAATAPLRLVSTGLGTASVSTNVTRWRVHPAGKDGTPGGAALTAYYAPAGGNSTACDSGSSAPLAVPVKRATPVVSVSPSPAVLAKTTNSTCDLKDLHAVVNVGASGGVTDCATPTGLVTLHVVRGSVADTPVRAANLLPAISQAMNAKVAQIAAAEVTAAAVKASHSAAETGSWKQAARAGMAGAREEATLLALDAAAGFGAGGADEKQARQASAARVTGSTPAQGRAAAEVVSTDAAGPGEDPAAADGAVPEPSTFLDRARTLLPPLPGGGLGSLFGRRRRARSLLGPIKETLDSYALIHRKVGAGVLMPTQLLPGMPGHARILPAGDWAGWRLVHGWEYTLVAQYSGDDNFEKAGGGGALVVESSCPLA